MIPALPEDYQEQGTLAAHHPSQDVRESRRRASISEKEEPHSPSLHRTNMPSLHPGITTIVLPPPTTSEMLNIQEYQPPVREAEKRMTRGQAAARGGSRSGSPTPGRQQRSPARRTRGSSRNEPVVDSRSDSVQTPPQAQSANRSPYLETQPSPSPGSCHLCEHYECISGAWPWVCVQLQTRVSVMSAARTRAGAGVMPGVNKQSEISGR